MCGEASCIAYCMFRDLPRLGGGSTRRRIEAYGLGWTHRLQRGYRRPRRLLGLVVPGAL